MPDYARDLRINLGVIAIVDGALACSRRGRSRSRARSTTRNRDLVAAVEADAARTLAPEALDAARGAAAIMGMNNVYYRFLHFMGDASEYGHMPARLRMQIIGNPGIDKLDFELACLAASAITGCEIVRALPREGRARAGRHEGDGAGRRTYRCGSQRRRGRAP